MSEIYVGDRVKFRAGRGHSTGRVANIAEGMATIATDAGKNVNRKLSQLAKVPHVGQPAEQSAMDAAPACSADAAV